MVCPLQCAAELVPESRLCRVGRDNGQSDRRREGSISRHMTVSSSPKAVGRRPGLVITYIRILHIIGRLDPFYFVADLVDRIHQGTNVPCHVVKKVNGRHDNLAADRACPANNETIMPD